jgi:hypothetical protein
MVKLLITQLATPIVGTTLQVRINASAKGEGDIMMWHVGDYKEALESIKAVAEEEQWAKWYIVCKCPRCGHECTVDQFHECHPNV